MKFTIEKENTAKFNFSVKPADFESALSFAYEAIKEKVEIKGFRKGHVPQKQYEKKYGEQSLYSDALNHIVGQLFDQALSVKELSIVSQPREIDVDVASISREKAFDITFIVDLKPTVTLGQYKEIVVSKQDTVVTDADVDVHLQVMLNKNKTLEPKTQGSLVVGDTAVFDFKGSVDGNYFEGGTAQNHSLEIGSGQFIPGFEEQMIGLKIGESKDVLVKFPEEYHAEDLAGKDAKFEVQLHEIKQPISPKLDDEWVKSLNIKDVSTVAQLKVYEKNQLTTQKEANAKREKTNEAIQKCVENAQVTIPQSMIDREVENYVQSVTQQAKQYQLELDVFLQLSGMSKEAFDAQALEQASKFVKQSLVIEEIAKAEKLKASKKELDARYQELANHYNMPVEEIKKYVNDELVTNDVTFAKAVELVTDSAVEK